MIAPDSGDPVSLLGAFWITFAFLAECRLRCYVMDINDGPSGSFQQFPSRERPFLHRRKAKRNESARQGHERDGARSKWYPRHAGIAVPARGCLLSRPPVVRRRVAGMEDLQRVCYGSNPPLCLGLARSRYRRTVKRSAPCSTVPSTCRGFRVVRPRLPSRIRLASISVIVAIGRPIRVSLPGAVGQSSPCASALSFSRAAVAESRIAADKRLSPRPLRTVVPCA